MSMPQGSPIREPLNRAILKILDSNEWKNLVEQYFDSGR
jgi:ABC-type amino acid transport substrate-binding protein